MPGEAPSGRPTQSEPPRERPTWQHIHEVVTYRDLSLVPGLEENKGLQDQWDLLRALVGQSPRDLVVNFTALRAIISNDRGTYSDADLRRALEWLTEQEQNRVLSAMRGTWLRFVPGKGTTVTYEAQCLYELLSLLFRRTSADDIATAMRLVEASEDLGLNEPERLLEAFRTRLLKLSDELKEAQESLSESRLREVHRKLPQGVDLMRAARESIQSSAFSTVREALVNEIFSAASQLALSGTDVIRQIQALERDHIPLPEGYAMRHVTDALRAQNLEDLASVGRQCLLATYTPSLMLNPVAVAAAADLQLDRERQEPAKLDLTPPEIPTQTEEEQRIPLDAERLLEELEALATRGEEPTLAQFVIRGDKTTTGFRLALLTLLGSDPGKGITGRMAKIPLRLLVEEGELEHPTTGPWKTISKGRLKRTTR